jgi:hypothetical protein
VVTIAYIALTESTGRPDGPQTQRETEMTNAVSPILGFANFVMAATPVLALVIAYVVPMVR